MVDDVGLGIRPSYVRGVERVVLDDEATALVVAEAERRGVEPAALAREAVAAYLAPARRRRLGFVALGDGRPGFSAATSEDVLGAEFGR